MDPWAHVGSGRDNLEHLIRLRECNGRDGVGLGIRQMLCMESRRKAQELDSAEADGLAKTRSGEQTSSQWTRPDPVWEQRHKRHAPNVTFVTCFELGNLQQ